jgi:hypothetical protein
MRRLLNGVAGAYLGLERRETPGEGAIGQALAFSRSRCLRVGCNLVSTAIQFPALSFPCNGWREKKLTKRSAAPFGFVCSMA